MFAELNCRILGWAKPHGEAISACSSCLFSVSTHQTGVLIDCGHGATSAFLTFGRLDDLGAVVITHLHPDHWMDFFCLRNALQEHGRSGEVTLHLGPGKAEVLRDICDTMGIGRDYFDTVFVVETYGPDAACTIEGLEFRFFPTRHSTETFGFCLLLAGRERIAFTSDTGPFDGLRDRLGQAAFVVMECSSLKRCSQVHLCVEDIVKILGPARHVQRLCVTHYPLKDRLDIQKRLEAELSNVEIVMAATGAIFHA